MNLTGDQTQKLLREHGLWITRTCDKCGKLLASVRWIQRGETGEWCSAECRDGIERSASMPPTPATAKPKDLFHRKRIGARPSGRPKKHRNNAEKCRLYRQRRKNVLVTRNTPSEITDS